jgi:hypothetical protein
MFDGLTLFSLLGVGRHDAQKAEKPRLPAGSKVRKLHEKEILVPREDDFSSNRPLGSYSLIFQGDANLKSLADMRKAEQFRRSMLKQQQSSLIFQGDANLKSLAAVIKAHWVCEQAHQQMKEALGLDHLEGRSWQGYTDTCSRP